MKIIFEHDDNRRVELTTDAVLINEVLSEIERALIAHGFEHDSIKAAICERAEEIEEENK